jgi:hypothetical protein
MFSSAVIRMKQAQRGLIAVVLLLLLAAVLQLPVSCTAFVVPVITTTTLSPTMTIRTASDTSSALHSSAGSTDDGESSNKSSSKSSKSNSSSNSNFLDKLFEEENNKLFNKYDIDNSGTIDKNEFKSVVKKMNKESRRREVFSIVSATLGSIFVASSSNTFQFGQKKFRSKYLEPNAELAMNENFPTALLSSDCEKLIFKTLHKRGFTPSNTLLGHSVCSDEVNTRGEQIIPLMIERWNKKGFALGGKF